LLPAVNTKTLKKLGFGSAGLKPGMQPKDRASVMVFPLNGDEQLWVGYQNFYAITRYNHSRFYAMAVFQLAQAINESS